MLTLTDVRDSLPAGLKGNINQGHVDQLNALSTDPEKARAMRDNFISFSQVLQEGKFKLGDYVKAVMYTSLKVMGKSNLEAYQETFPERYQKMVAEGRSNKDISAYVAAYHKGSLVTKVLERSMVPTWVLNQDMFQQALNVQYEIMNDTTESGKTRVEAANSLLTHLKRPESNKAELSIEIGLNDGMRDLQNSISQMAQIQQQKIIDGEVTARDMAHLTMRDVTPDADER